MLRPYNRDELVAIGAPGGSSRRARGPRPRLDAQCWILREESSTTRRDVEAWLNRHGIVVARSMTFDGPDAVKRAVMAGLGIAIVSKLTVDEELKARRLIELDLGLPLPVRDVYLVDHPQKHHGAACGAMLRLLATTFTPSASPSRPSDR